MAGINTIVTFECSEYRPCLVDGEKALFHRWVDEEKILLRLNFLEDNDLQKKLQKAYKNNKVVAVDGGEIVTAKVTLAIVELANGMIKEVEPTHIRFIDNKINEFAFDDERSNHNNGIKKSN